MTDRDLLERATSALRAAHDGKRTGAGFTRARIMNTLHQQKRRRLSWWITFGPALALLLGGSAWAQSSGNWPLVLRSVTAMFAPLTRSPVAQQVPERAAPRAHSRGDAAPPVSATSPPAQLDMEAEADSQVPEELAVLPDPSAPETEQASLAAPSLKSPARAANPELRRAARRSEELAPLPAVPTPSVPDPDPELATFRRAHDLHFKQGSPAAVAAYEDYLRRHPEGRFVPEARYTLALAALKRGDHAEAKRRLQPFADGAYGPNRRAAARALLASLPGAKGAGDGGE